MGKVNAWVQSHPWASVIAAALLGVAAGASGGGSGNSSTLRADLVTARAYYSEAQAEVSGLQTKNSDLQTANSDLESEIQSLSSRLDDLQEKFELLKSTRPLPNLVGLTKGRIKTLADRYGWTMVVTKRVSSAAPGTVISQRPAQGEDVHKGSEIRIVIAKAPPAPKPQPEPEPVAEENSPNCTPGYSPCLPPASDYDCAGGSGDGPKYTGRVTVTGSDPYGLDSDGDGVGCES
ncbi:MAG: PASTA domain-containing protein [Actinomycetota bacterium]